MATTSKATKMGDYICKVGFYDIRQKTTQRKAKNGIKNEVAKSEFVICKGKKLIESGFNTKEKAVLKATELLGDKKSIYGLN